MKLISDITGDISLGDAQENVGCINMNTHGLTGVIASQVTDITYSEANRKEYSPFPKGVEEVEIPDVVQNSWKKVQEHGLSPEKQSKISYYKNHGEWFINLDGTRISMQNESALHNPNAGITVEKGNTYFSQSAARMYAHNKRQRIPANSLWEKMANFLGGFAQLKDILQIPSAGWFCPRFDDFRGIGLFATVWSADNHGYLDASDNHGYTSHVSDAGYGLSLRLLDRFGDSSHI